MHCCLKPEFIPDSSGRRGNRLTSMEAKQREWLSVSSHNQAKEPQLKQGSPPLKVSALTHLNQYETCGLRRTEGAYVHCQVGFPSMLDASPFCARVHSLTLSLWLFPSDRASLADSPELLHEIIPAFRPRSSLLTGYRALDGVQGH